VIYYEPMTFVAWIGGDGWGTTTYYETYYPVWQPA
jgi:hypothetical protein